MLFFKNSTLRTIIVQLLSFMSLYASAQQFSLREKIFMHFDKNEYVTGDTIWFKTYIVDALTQKPSVKSGVYYVELINQQKDFVRRFNYHVVLGTSFGQIPTDTSYFEPGLYKIRAYTRWLQNFGDSLFYEKDIVINDGSIYKKWFLNMSPPALTGDSVETRLMFTNEAGQPQAVQAVAFELFEGKKHAILKSKLQLDASGGIDVKFKLPKQIKKQQLRAKVSDPADRKQVYLDIPINFKKPDVDLQFMPEGGHLIAGLKNKVGFKAIDQNGLGANIQAIVKANDESITAKITSIYKGMGYFEFVPEAGKTYKAVLAGGKEIMLPKVEVGGPLLKVEHRAGEEKVYIKVVDNQAPGGRYLLSLQTRGYNVYKDVVQLNQGAATLAIPQVAFPSGVTIATLLNQKGEITSQRQFFIDNKEGLNLEINQSADSYVRRDSISLKVTVTDKEGRPVIGSFSMAVTDDGQVQKDVKTDENLFTWLLMQSDLKGNIETPNYYFSNTSDTAAKALDALMLTQGFVSYSWDTTRFTLKPEPEYEVSGRVVNFFNKDKGLANYGVSLYTYSGSRFRMKTMADKDGYFRFKSIPQFDTAKFFISVKADTIDYKFGDKISSKRFKVQIAVDPPIYPSLKNVLFERYYHPRLNLDSNILKTVRSRNMRFISDDPTMLEEVVVKSNGLRGSKNLNGPGNADQIITEEEVKSADSDMNIFDFLKKHVNGYVMPTSYVPMEFDRGGNGDEVPNLINQNFFGSLKGPRNKLYIFIDGQPVSDPFLRPNISFTQLKPKDIKSLELITSPKRTMRYNKVIGNLYQDPSVLLSGARRLEARGLIEWYFLEITTQDGGGLSHVIDSGNPGIDQIPTPIFHYGKSSYVPKYDVINSANPKPDFRSTIYWEPTVVTNEKGEASVSFYAADNPGTYTISLQGISLNGDFGVKTGKIKIAQ